jgi:ATP-dependent protease ClpP protease subunit
MPKNKNGLNRLSAPLNINRGVYAMAMDGDNAEIELYGDIVEQQPTDWWGDPIEGNFIILEDFLKDFESISKAKNITFRINSYGGDCMVGMVIHNKIRELSRAGKNITAIVDGVAMSAASVIMSACDTVRVNPASLVMIHKCWGFMFGGYNADELRDIAEHQDAYDRALATAYIRKTNLSQTQILHMMSETVYMTGKEAVEKGFADELIEDEAPVQIAASADGRSLFVGGKEMHLAPGMFAPDFIPTVTAESEKEDAETDGTISEEPSNVGSLEGGHDMTLAELREQYPELIAQAEAEATAGNAKAIESAVQAERARMADIDEIAVLYDVELVHEAKYGETACSAAELAHRAAVAAAKSGKTFLANMEEDAKESGAADVEAAPASEEEDKEPQTEEEKLDKARAQVRVALGKN